MDTQQLSKMYVDGAIEEQEGVEERVHMMKQGGDHSLKQQGAEKILKQQGGDQTVKQQGADQNMQQQGDDWTVKKQSNTQIVNMQVDEKSQVKRRRAPTREESKNHLNLIESFLEKSCHASEEPDICFQTFNKDLKLRGGARLKVFDTENEEMGRVLTLFRSLRVFDNFKEHSKCKLSSRNPKDSLCSFCLMRSIMLKS